MNSFLLSSRGGYLLELTLEHSDIPNGEVRVGGDLGSGLERLQKAPHHFPRRNDFLGASEVLNTHNLSEWLYQAGRHTLHVFGKWVMGDKPPGKTERGVFG